MRTSLTAQRRAITAAQWLELVKRHERAGELFLAYDLARQALEKFPEDLCLKHRAVLCLASTGATRKAEEEFVRLKLEALPNISLADPLGLDIATLKPRLLKEAALVEPANTRQKALAVAADAYERVYEEAKHLGNR